MDHSPSLLAGLVLALRRRHLNPTRFILSISVATQTMRLFECTRDPRGEPSTTWLQPGWKVALRKAYLISTSKYGVGQTVGSNQTPIGLHRVARKIGGGHPIGTVFRGRKPVGLTWRGLTDASIVHRILWLEGLEPGHNSGGDVDTFRRYIYIHGFGDEPTLGRPSSHGCVHLAASDLLPLFDRVRLGTLVWIAER